MLSKANRVNLALKNPHPRDARIAWVQGDPGHIDIEKRGSYWTVDGKKCVHWGVKRKLEAWYYPKTFDPDVVYKNKPPEERIRQERLNFIAMQAGLFFHSSAELFLNGLEFQPHPDFPDIKKFEDIPSWQIFLDFMACIPKEWKLYRTEWAIFSKKSEVLGVMDLVLIDTSHHEDDKIHLIIVDFKCVTKPDEITWCGRLQNECGANPRRDATKHKDGCKAVGLNLARRFVRTKKIENAAQLCVYKEMVDLLYGNMIVDRLFNFYVHPDYPEIDEINYVEHHDLVLDYFKRARKDVRAKIAPKVRVPVKRRLKRRLLE